MKTVRIYTAAVLCLFSLAALPQDAHAANPERDGLTLELGLGAAFSHVAWEGAPSLNEFGNSMLTLSLGLFLNNDFAIMAHMAGAAAYPTFMENDRVLVTNQFLGIVGQYWFTERFFVSGGAGAALWGVSFDDEELGSSTDYGFALSARAGYSFASWQNHSLRVALEMIPEFFDSRTVLATALNLEWQYF